MTKMMPKTLRTKEEIQGWAENEAYRHQQEIIRSLMDSLHLPAKEAYMIATGTDREGRQWRETEAWKRLTRAAGTALVIILKGPNGTGKSSAACRYLANRSRVIISRNGIIEKIDAWDDGIYLRAPDCARIADLEEDRLEKIWGARTLVIDDLGEEAELGDKAIGRLRAILTRRDDAITPKTRTVITTNLTREEIASRYGKRVFDRLRELAVVINVTEIIRIPHQST